MLIGTQRLLFLTVAAVGENRENVHERGPDSRARVISGPQRADTSTLVRRCYTSQLGDTKAPVLGSCQGALLEADGCFANSKVGLRGCCFLPRQTPAAAAQSVAGLKRLHFSCEAISSNSFCDFDGCNVDTGAISSDAPALGNVTIQRQQNVIAGSVGNLGRTSVGSLMSLPAGMIAARKQKEFLRAQLAGLKMSELRRRAKFVGITATEIDHALDSDAPKVAIINMIVRRAHSSGAGQRTSEPLKKKPIRQMLPPLEPLKKKSTRPLLPPPPPVFAGSSAVVRYAASAAGEYCLQKTSKGKLGPGAASEEGLLTFPRSDTCAETLIALRFEGIVAPPGAGNLLRATLRFKQARVPVAVAALLEQSNEALPMKISIEDTASPLPLPPADGLRSALQLVKRQKHRTSLDDTEVGARGLPKSKVQQVSWQIKHGNASRSADISDLLSKVISKPGYKGDVVLYLRPNALVEAMSRKMATMQSRDRGRRPLFCQVDGLDLNRDSQWSQMPALDVEREVPLKKPEDAIREQFLLNERMQRMERKGTNSMTTPQPVQPARPPETASGKLWNKTVGNLHRTDVQVVIVLIVFILGARLVGYWRKSCCTREPRKESRS